MVCDYEVKDSTLRVNCLGCVFGSSIEDFEACMAKTIDKLLEVKNVERIILAETRENEYDFEQVKLLAEIAKAYNRIVNEDRILKLSNLGPMGCEQYYPRRLAELQFLVLEVLRKDPIGAYQRINKLITRANINLERAPPHLKKCFSHYLEHALLPIKRILESCELIKLAKPYMEKYKPGDRRIYREFFRPIVRPNFMLTRFMLTPPKNANVVDKYYVQKNVLVEILKVPGKVRFLYHITPPEFKLSEEKYLILDNARRYLAAHKPTETEMTEPEKARELFFNIGKDLVAELARNLGVNLSSSEIEELANLLVRYTAGFGVLELLLSDEKIQDIYINSPVGLTPIFVYHSDFEECETNLIPTKEDAEAWATRFRLYSGRPLDEANPVLDTELQVPGGRARVAAITRSLSPEGLAFAFRRHRERPWTYPLFLKSKMFDPLYAGLMSFIVDGGRALLIAGGRSSGKTSLLSATLLEIMRRFRLIIQEDSVTGDCKILVSRNGKIEKTTVGKLVDDLMKKYGYEKIEDKEILRKNPENIKVISLGQDGKLKFSRVNKFIRHKVSKEIFEIETRTGRKIKVTGDHSLFSLDKNGKIQPVKAKELSIGSYIVTPRKLPFENKKIEKINLLEHLDKLKKGFVIGPSIKTFIKKHKKIVKKIAKELNYSRRMINHWYKKSIFPLKILTKILKLGYSIDKKNLKFKIWNNAKCIPVLIELDPDFLTFIGLWLADGCYDTFSIIISVVDEDSREIVYKTAKKFGIRARMHSDGFSLILGSQTLKTIMKNVLELKGNSKTKKIPAWIFSLSKKQISYVLKGIFSGDGYLAKNEVGIGLQSFELMKDIQTLCLLFGIIFRTNRKNKRDSTYPGKISALSSIKNFRKNIGFLQKNRMEKLKKMCKKVSTHDISDIIPLPLETKIKISKILPGFSYYDYVRRNYHVGKRKLNQMIEKISLDGGDELLKNLKILAESDIFWDEIKSIKCLGKLNEYVYDFSVPGCENFVCENILAHNTLELPVAKMRQLGYNIERLKSRSVITRVETELPADEALRTALRLGDSCLIVGEVRSVESTVLFEAMRIGALANVVAGTIHGESPYGVFDRVVHDLGVAPTSFKAIDLITICNMLRSPDGLHRFRRVVELTEVRKHWKEDPYDEGGFVTLMEYSAKEDRLKPTETLINGESYVLDEIAKRVREWHGNWDAVWDNILLRARIKQTMVEYAERLNRPEILEAEMVCDSNDMFHLISEKVRKEVGGLDSKMIFDEWLGWFKSRLK